MRRLAVAACVLLCAFIIQPARAQTCTVSGTGVAFGIYAPLSGSGVTTTATITVTCNPGVISIFVSYTIALSIGGGSSYALRSMGGPTPRLQYQLYRDSAYSQVWGRRLCRHLHGHGWLPSRPDISDYQNLHPLRRHRSQRRLQCRLIHRSHRHNANVLTTSFPSHEPKVFLFLFFRKESPSFLFLSPPAHRRLHG